jgi:hypothetical protein
MIDVLNVNKNNKVVDLNMKRNFPNMVGNHLPVMAYIEPAIFMEIETVRGDVPRSRFLGKIIEKSIKEAC